MYSINPLGISKNTLAATSQSRADLELCPHFGKQWITHCSTELMSLSYGSMSCTDPRHIFQTDSTSMTHWHSHVADFGSGEHQGSQPLNCGVCNSDVTRENKHQLHMILSFQGYYYHGVPFGHPCYLLPVQLCDCGMKFTDGVPPNEVHDLIVPTFLLWSIFQFL